MKCKHYLGDISALCFIHTNISSLPYLLAGTGSEILLYNLETGKLVKSFRVFGGIRVHGITCCATKNNNTNIYNNGVSIDINNETSLLPCNVLEEFTIAVFGERRVKLFKLNISSKFVELNLLHLIPKFGHWVLDVSFLIRKKDEKAALSGDSPFLAIGCSDNSIHFWNSLCPQEIIKVESPDKCLLYSMRMWGNTVENLFIASGTIFNQIIVWKVVASNHSNHNQFNLDSCPAKALKLHGQQYQAVHICRLAGHEGSIFRIDWSSDGNRLVSVSDDRSARLWDIYRDKYELDSCGDIIGSHSVGPVLFGHNARVWDCCIFDNLIVTAGEDCTCRVWAPDGNQVQMIKDHIGRGIWRCLYDPNSSLLVTAGFDSSIKVQKLHESMFKDSGRHHTEVEGMADRRTDFTLQIPRASGHVGLLNSKSEYVRCLRFACENVLYVATNNGYLYHAKLSKMGVVKWTEIVRVSEAVAIVCMDVLSISSPDSLIDSEDWVACGDGKGNMTIVSIVSSDDSPNVGFTFSWSAEIERQLLGTYWCKSLGSRFIFTSDPRGTLKLWKLGGTLQSVSQNSIGRSDVSLVTKFTSCFGTQIMCLDASFEQEVLVCGDLRGNLMLFPLFKHLLLSTSSEPETEVFTLNHFKSAHGISSVCSISLTSYSSSQLEILSTGGDGCICTLEYDRSTQNLEFLGMKQVKDLSSVQSVSSSDLTYDSYVIGFSSTNFLIWNLVTETKVAQIPCGGWRRPYSYYLGDVPETQNCFAFVKDEIIYVRYFWVHDSERKIYPQNLHLQFHGREMHSVCFISGDNQSNTCEYLFSKPSWIATGCEGGTVRLTGYDPNVGEWCGSKLLGEHVGGSSVRSLCYMSTIHEFSQGLSAMTAETTMQQVTENPVLLISVGSKRVLTCWKQKIRSIGRKEETVATRQQDGTYRSTRLVSGSSSLMSFQWLSSDMPVKQCSTREGRGVPTGEKVEQDVSSSLDEGKLESDTCTGYDYENDWRYLAVTAFLVKISCPRLTVCFVVVACSDATLTLRALLLPYRLWFDIASLVPHSSPILALQHAVIPVSATSDENIQTKNVFLVVGGSTDGNITFWDLTPSVEKFMQSLPAFQMKNSADCQKRPRTGRGSQGGRWWKSSAQKSPSLNPNGNCMSEDTTGVAGIKIPEPALCDIPSESADTASGKTNYAEDIVSPLLVLSGVHQSGVNCLHMSSIKNSRSFNSRDLYCVLSGGDDQALHSLVFDMEMRPFNQCTEYKKQDAVCEASKQHGPTKNVFHFGQLSNYNVRICFRGKVASAHGSAVKGIWTDGSWVFSTGLDQRIRCWLLENNGKVTEQASLITSVPEPEALDARPCGKEGYQIVVAGRGMEIIDFSTLCGMDDSVD